MFGKLSETLLEVKDLAASRTFYTEKLGLPVTAEGEGWCSLNADGHSIVMWQGNKPAVMLGFDGADLAAAKATLAQRGVTTSELMDHPGGKHFELTDPDGNLIMISSNNQ